MRTLDGSALEVAAALRDDVAADYVYMYPPRQAYRPVAAEQLDAAVVQSLARGDALKLPFRTSRGLFLPPPLGVRGGL